MKIRRILCLVMALCCFAGAAGRAVAAQVECDDVYCFSVGDFSQDEQLAGICITGLPDARDGTVMLGARVLQPGDILTAEQIGNMTFHPLRNEQETQAEVEYLPIFADRVEAAAVMSIAVIGKQDKAPVAEDSALETYRNLPNEAMLKAKDPEGQKLTYTVTRAPKRGEVTIREDGSFVYTPKKNKVGIDSFAYTAADPAGNVSREATVTIQVMKPSDAAQYSDTAGKSCRFAAEWMKNTGIFVAESINGNGCFRPEKTVSRGEFLTMLVGTLGLELEEDAQVTGFSDDAPQWLKPYLAAAMRSGLTAGWPEGYVFRAEEPITGEEAAVMLQNALDLSASEQMQVEQYPEDAVSAWAEQSLMILRSHGIELYPNAGMTRGQTAEVMYQVSRLMPEAPGARTLRAAQ